MTTPTSELHILGWVKVASREARIENVNDSENGLHNIFRFH